LQQIENDKNEKSFSKIFYLFKVNLNNSKHIFKISSIIYIISAIAFFRMNLFLLYKNALLKRAHNMFSTDKLIVKNSLYYILKIVFLKFQKPDLLN
jgi:hypothetical protein